MLTTIKDIQAIGKGIGSARAYTSVFKVTENKTILTDGFFLVIFNRTFGFLPGEGNQMFD